MMRLITFRNRDYFTFGDAEPGSNLHVGYRADHDFERGPASLVLIPVESVPRPPWMADEGADDGADEGADDGADEGAAGGRQDDERRRDGCQAVERAETPQAADEGPHARQTEPAVVDVADSSEDHRPGDV